MRSKLMTSPKGLQVRGIAGTYVVLLALNCPKSYCKGLLGFAIFREDKTSGEKVWLKGLKKFDLPGSDEGDIATTQSNPIQKFHWGDYTTNPGETYRYTISAMKGKPGALKVFETVELNVTCETPDQVGKNGHAVHWNRSAAASQAFARRFPNLPKGEVVDPNARVWLSRGLEEALIGFIKETKKNEGLHIYLYEFNKPSFLDALLDAEKRGVRLELIYDAIVKRGVGPSIESKPLLEQLGDDSIRGRDGAGINISHNKFMVRTDVKGQPKAVWTGSTNFTDSGIYAQANVGHMVADPDLAQVYFDWHQEIWADPDKSKKESQVDVMKLTEVPEGEVPAGVTLVLSPRTTIEAVTACAKLVTAGQRMVCFTAPFALHKDLEAALVSAPAQVFGLLNKDSVVGQALHDAPNTMLAAAGALNEASVLEAWQKQLLEESLHHSGVMIHTKVILIDPLSDNPIVISGSANFSNNSSVNNDENQLFIAGETEVADIYLGEFMRMFDHYYFRDYLKKVAAEKALNPKAGFLSNTDDWTNEYFDQSQRQELREAFF